MDFQQQRYMRPPAPPPPMADQHHYQQPPPPPPAQPQAPWFSGQFQYHPSQHSPSPPPPHQQWAPPPQSDHLHPSPYPAPAHPPYPVQSLHSHQYPPPPPLPPRPHLPPPHPHSHVPQSYPQVNQEWGNPNWSHHQGWEYPAHNHEEDLVARARAWAAASAATDNQHSQSHFTPVVGRPEEQSHYHSHYPQNVDPHYLDVQQSALSSSNYQPYPSSVVAPPHRTTVGGHPQDSASFSSGYLPQDGYLPHDTRDGNFAGDANTSFHHRESSSASLLVHQQEVPSSYSSVAGKEEAANQTEKFYNSMPLPPSISTSQHYAQPPLPSAGRSVSIEQPHYSFANQSVEPATDLSDQPLDFAPRFPRDHDPHLQPNYTHAWTPPLAPGGVLYPPLDPAAAVSSSAPMFGRMPGPGFQPAIPSVNTAFGMGAGTTVHPSAVFPVDAYGVSERPKKASVPNWLREEIIKKKPIITSSAPELSKEEAISFEDEGVDDKSSGKGDQANSKGVDSSRSTEEENDDDEDYVEAARTAAMNQEIKRVLTEVLLKVTDELFDEIATKVLSEHDDLTVEVKHNGAASVHSLSPSTPAVQTPKASAKVLIPPKAKESHSDDVIEKSTSSTPGDVLGLGNYASDEDEDDAIQSSDVPNPKGSNVHQNPNKLSEDIRVDNGGSKAETERLGKSHIDVESMPGTMSPSKAKVNHNAVVSESMHGDFRDNIADDEKVLDVSDVSKSKNGVGDKVVTRTELPVESLTAKKSISDDSQSRETRNKRDKNDRTEKRSSSGKEIVKDDDNRRRQDERHARKERTNDQNGSTEKMKEQNMKSGEKAKDSDSRKRSTHLDAKEDRKDIQRERRTSGKESNDRKRERTKDDKGERSRHKYGNDSSRHKRRCSSSGGNDSSDDSLDDSKRKVHSERRKSSPSPVRSRRRQVSRSPHSKHSQRRHSPYSSLETTRGRRSRSRSPVRRQR